VLSGVVAETKADGCRDPERWTAEAMESLAQRADRLRDETVFRPLVVEFMPYGVHFVDRIFGAEVFELHEKGNWQVRLLGRPVGSLEPPDLGRNETWAEARRVAEAFLAARVSVPCFGLPVIASALNVGMNLFGEALLVAMHTEPEAARHDLRVINDTLCALHRWYRERLPAPQLQPVIAGFRTQPPGYGQLCGCSTQLLSPGMYRDFVAPLDDELLRVHAHGGMIHLCGRHTQHLAAWREMRSLRAVQVNDRACEELESYFRELRDDQIIYVNPCAGMSVERAMEVTGGRRVVIVADVREALAVRAPG